MEQSSPGICYATRQVEESHTHSHFKGSSSYIVLLYLNLFLQGSHQDPQSKKQQAGWIWSEGLQPALPSPLGKGLNGLFWYDHENKARCQKTHISHKILPVGVGDVYKVGEVTPHLFVLGMSKEGFLGFIPRKMTRVQLQRRWAQDWIWGSTAANHMIGLVLWNGGCLVVA